MEPRGGQAICDDEDPAESSAAGLDADCDADGDERAAAVGRRATRPALVPERVLDALPPDGGWSHTVG